MSIQELRDRIKKHEGMSQFVYRDSLGYQTIGIGRCVDKLIGHGLSEDEQEYLLTNDITNLKYDLGKFAWFKALDDVRKEAIIELAFNMGTPKLLQFKNMLDALSQKDYSTAAKELVNSKWYSQVSQARSKDLYNRILNGKY